MARSRSIGSIMNVVVFIVGGIFLTNASAMAAQADAKKNQSAKASKAMKETAPAGYVIVEESLVTDIADMTFDFLSDANQAFRDKNFGEAAADLQAAARVMRVEGNATKDREARSEIMDAAEMLDQMAPQVKSGKIKDEKQFTALISDATVHRARHYRLRAASEWANKEFRRAGHDIRSSIEAVEHGSQLLGTEVQKGETKSLNAARGAAAKLIAGAGFSSTEVSKAFDHLGGSIDRLGQKVAPPSSVSGSTSDMTTGAEDAASTPTK